MTFIGQEKVGRIG